jgi:LPXTG-site transpeptidase (sortase) family protein
VAEIALPASLSTALLVALLVALLGAAGLGFALGRHPVRWLLVRAFWLAGGVALLAVFAGPQYAVGEQYLANTPLLEKIEAALQPSDGVEPASGTTSAPASNQAPFPSAAGFAKPGLNNLPAPPPLETAQPETTVQNPTPSPLPAPLERVTALPPVPFDGRSEHVLRLTIPSINVDAHVQDRPLEQGTWDLAGLGLDVAWLEGTALPGALSNTVLVGHITVEKSGNGPFRRLNQVKNGELLFIFTERMLYTYKVREQKIVAPQDVYVTEPTETPQLTLLTCTVWDTKARHYKFRRAVIADLLRADTLPEQP